MQTIKNLVLQIIEILEYFVEEGYAVVIPTKYFSDRSQSLNTLGAELGRLNQRVTDYLFVGVINKTPAEALCHVKRVLEEINLAEVN